MAHPARLSSRTLKTLLILTVLLAALAVRIVNLEADPSALISRDYITDEGQWAHNARNVLIYGQWRMDGYNPGVYSAYLYHHLLRLGLSAFGLSLASIRMLSALFGSLTVALLFAWVRRETNTRTAIVAAVFLGVSNLHILYSRTGFVESTMVFFLALALWLWSLRQRHRIFAFLSGLALGLMLLTKVTAAYILPGLALFAVLEMVRKTTTRQDGLLFICGAALVASCYVIGFVVPNYTDWITYNLAAGLDNEWSSGPSDLVDTMLRVLTWRFFWRTPILTALSLIALGGLVLDISTTGLKRAIRSASNIEVTVIALLIGYMMAVGLQGYQPERRFIPVLFLMAPLSACTLDKGWSWYQSLTESGTKLRTGAWFALLFALPAAVVLNLRWEAVGQPRSIRLWLFKAVVIAVFAGISVALSRGRWPSPLRHYFVAGARLLFGLSFCALLLKLIYQPLMLWGFADELRSERLLASALLILATTVSIVAGLKLRAHIAVLTIALFIFIEGFQISSWLLQPTYTLKHASLALANLIKEGETVVTGYETLLVSSSAKAVCYRPEIGFNASAFEKYDPDYILILRRDDWRDHALGEMPVNEWPPPAPADPTAVARFDLCPTRARGSRFSLELYSLNRNRLNSSRVPQQTGRPIPRRDIDESKEE